VQRPGRRAGAAAEVDVHRFASLRIVGCVQRLMQVATRCEIHFRASRRCASGAPRSASCASIASIRPLAQCCCGHRSVGGNRPQPARCRNASRPVRARAANLVGHSETGQACAAGRPPSRSRSPSSSRASSARTPGASSASPRADRAMARDPCDRSLRQQHETRPPERRHLDGLNRRYTGSE